MAGRPYPNPPIQEALVVFQFQPVEQGGWNWTVPGRLWMHMNEVYDGEPRSEHVVTVNAQQQARQMAAAAAGGVGRVFLTRKDQSGLVGIAPNQLSVHVLRPYPGWKEFRPRIERVLSEYPEVHADALVSRVGLRYVNRIDIPAGNIEMSQWFTASPGLPPGLEQTMAGLMSKVDTVFDDGARMSITLAAVPSADESVASFLLDLDMHMALGEPVPLDADLRGRIDALHAREGDAFEAMITDETRGLFQ